MKDIPDDILQAAYAAAAASELRVSRDVLAVVIAQSVAAERNRAAAHSTAAVAAIRRTLDGDADRVLMSAIDIAMRADRAIRSGEPS